MQRKRKRSLAVMRRVEEPRYTARGGRLVRIYGYVLLVCGLYALLEFTPVDQYVTALKANDPSVLIVSRHHIPEPSASIRDEGALLEQIEAAAIRLKEEPVDAKVDPVWKAIPGYNGLEVDVERTLQANLNHTTTSEISFIMREVEPNVQLEDLGAHPIYKGNPKKKIAGFMINVAWGDEYLAGIIETLQREKVPATFFFDGSWLSKHLEQARAICAAGFECSNHAYTHPNMSQLSRTRQAEEIVKTEKLLQDELGVKNRWFAPPSGDYNQTTVDVAYELGLRTVLWTIDTVDWKKPEPEWIIRRISTKLEPGSLILMHPTASSSQALSGMIAAIRAEGYAFGTVAEVLSSKRISDVEEALDF